MTKKELQLQKGIDGRDEQIRLLMEQLEMYRQYFNKRLRRWIELIGEGSSPNLQWLIEQDIKFLHSIKSWYW